MQAGRGSAAVREELDGALARVASLRCFSLSHTLSLSLSLSLSLTHTHTHTVFLSDCRSVFLSLCLTFSISLRLCRFFSTPFCLFATLSLFFYAVSLSLALLLGSPLALSLHLYVSMSLPFSVALSLCHCVLMFFGLFGSLCLHVFLGITPSLSPCHSWRSVSVPRYLSASGFRSPHVTLAFLSLCRSFTLALRLGVS